MNEWIPITKRQPMPGMIVLLTLEEKDHHRILRLGWRNSEGEYVSLENSFESIERWGRKVIAWMHTPRCYEG